MIIQNKQEYYSAMAEIEGYLQKGFSTLTPSEDERLDELSKAVEGWELKEYPMPFQPEFSDILRHIMSFKQLSQSQLSENLSISKSLLSEVLKGKRQPNLEIVIRLHKNFGIDANLLLDSIGLRA
jgi:antitoxin component HigA of HigAB toxin-antitoxin module